jgi:hypothetical protein
MPIALRPLAAFFVVALGACGTAAVTPPKGSGTTTTQGSGAGVASGSPSQSTSTIASTATSASAAPIACTSGTACGSACVDVATSATDCGACGHSCLGGTCQAGKCSEVVAATTELDPLDVVVAGDTLFTRNYGGYSYYVKSVPIAGGEYANRFSSGGFSNAIASDGVDVWWSSGVGKVGSAGLWKMSAAPGAKAPEKPAYEYSLELSGGVYSVHGVAVDATHVYWSTDKSISRMPKAGGKVEVLSWTGAANASLVIGGDWLYFAGSETVMRVPIAGGVAKPERLATMQASPYALAVDAESVYFATTDGAIKKSPVTGGKPVVLASKQYSLGGMVLDGGFLYYTTTVKSGALRKLSVAGGEPIDLAKDQMFPHGLALDAKTIWWCRSTPPRAGASHPGELVKLAR